MQFPFHLHYLAYLNAFIELCLYLCMFLPLVYFTRTLWLAMYQSTRGRLLGAAQRRRLRTEPLFRTSTNEGKEFSYFRLSSHIQNLMEISVKKTTPTSYRTFGWVTLCTFAGVYFVLFITSDNLFVPILPGLVLAICPYIYLIARRHMLSIRNSYDIGPVVKALIPKYRASHRNMRHALPLLTKTETQTPFVRALARLHLKLNRAHSSEHAQEIIRNFNAQTGTDWSKRLSSLIYKAYIENIDVEDALVKLEEDITATQAAMKDGRTERMDTFLLGILPVFALPGGLALLYIAVTRNAFHYQFGTPQGIKSFVMSLVVSLAAALVGIIFNRPKQDI